MAWNRLEWAGIGRNKLEFAGIGLTMQEYSCIFQKKYWFYFILFLYIIFHSLAKICSGLLLFGVYIGHLPVANKNMADLKKHLPWLEKGWL